MISCIWLQQTSYTKAVQVNLHKSCWDFWEVNKLNWKVTLVRRTHKLFCFLLFIYLFIFTTLLPIIRGFRYKKMNRVHLRSQYLTNSSPFFEDVKIKHFFHQGRLLTAHFHHENIMFSHELHEYFQKGNFFYCCYF